MVFILCPECGKGLAIINPFWVAVKTQHTKNILENNTIDVDNLDFKPDILSGLDYIMKALHINNMCCRSHIIGDINLDVL